MNDLKKDIQDAINKHCAESASGTLDFILAQYLIDCLNAFNMAMISRQNFEQIDDEEDSDAVEQYEPKFGDTQLGHNLGCGFIFLAIGAAIALVMYVKFTFSK